MLQWAGDLSIVGTVKIQLHYIYDPLCGWCYGAGPLIQAARELPDIALSLHGGGMMAGPRRQRVTQKLRDYVMPHDRRISARTGQPFGPDYFDVLLRDTTAVFDSSPPIAAVLIANERNLGLPMLARLQRAHYVEGRRIADIPVLAKLAVEFGIDPNEFARQIDVTLSDRVPQHIADSRKLLARVGGQGFPTLAQELDNGDYELLDLGPWLGNSAGWRQHLARRVSGDPGG